MICAIGICASIVDVSPFSSVGATIVATTVDPRPTADGTAVDPRGLSLVLVGPAVMIGLLVLPAMLTSCHTAPSRGARDVCQRSEASMRAEVSRASSPHSATRPAS